MQLCRRGRVACALRAENKTLMILMKATEEQTVEPRNSDEMRRRMAIPGESQSVERSVGQLSRMQTLTLWKILLLPRETWAETVESATSKRRFSETSSIVASRKKHILEQHKIMYAVRRRSLNQLPLILTVKKFISDASVLYL